jgi:predicted secreted protein with PEFG-CTERM motif
MKTHLLLVLSAVLIANVGIGAAAFGEETQEPIYADTNKSSYLENEVIEITGNVKAIHTGLPVTLTVTSPSGNLVAVDQITVGEDKKFSATVVVGGMLKTNGEYTISVMYAQDKISIPFNVIGFSSNIIEGSFEIEELLNPITYQISGGKLIDIQPDVDQSSLVLSIDAKKDGSITLSIPRTVFDSVSDGKDDKVMILVEGTSVPFEETTTSNDRTFIIKFQEGVKRIEIIGTFVIPEFGTIAAMILVVAIISIIAVSSKTRLSIMPRY